MARRQPAACGFLADDAENLNRRRLRFVLWPAEDPARARKAVGHAQRFDARAIRRETKRPGRVGQQLIECRLVDERVERAKVELERCRRSPVVQSVRIDTVGLHGACREFGVARQLQFSPENGGAEVAGTD